MTEKDILKNKLVTFLKSNNAYECFIYNIGMYSSHKIVDIDLLCSNIIITHRANSIIAGAFFWDRTPEGYSFWRRLHDYFQENYKSLPYENIVDEMWDNMWEH